MLGMLYVNILNVMTVICEYIICDDCCM